MKRARLCIPFLKAYLLESAGAICDWVVVTKYKFTANDPFTDSEAICCLIEAYIPDERHELIEILRSKDSYHFAWIDDNDPINKFNHLTLPKSSIGMGILKLLNTNRHEWLPCTPRFVQWNPSYKHTGGPAEVTVELFEYQAVYCYWICDIVTRKPKSKYEVVLYENLNSAKEFLRIVSLFTCSCNTKRSSGVLVPQYFYLSIVYLEPFLSELMNRYMCVKDTSFLHELFHLWGRFTKDDPKEIWDYSSSPNYRKIRV